MAKVHEQAELVTGCFQIVVDLSTMFVVQGRHGFDFKNDFPVTDKIRLVSLLELPSLIVQYKLNLFLERDVPESQFKGEAFLIHGFHKSTTLLVVNLEACSRNLVALVLIHNRHCYPFPLIRVIRVIRGCHSFR